MRAAVTLAFAMFAAATAVAQRAIDPYEIVTVVLPAGNAAAGRQAFRELKCHLCHQVAGETRLPAPVASARGPELGAITARQSSSDVAAAIIAPSHSMSVRTDEALKKRLAVESVSPMGDFSATVTVRQLADLLAYLRTAGAVR